MSAKEKLFAKEADLVAAFCGVIDPARWARNPAHAPKWTAYHETAGWDVLLAHPSGVQIGIEAKLVLNPKVLVQALPNDRYWDRAGPDYRAALVPADGLQGFTSSLAQHLGLAVIVVRKWGHRDAFDFQPSLPHPGEADANSRDWPNWLPLVRCKLPEYVPDVTGGHAAPLQLSDWKIKAIKLLILLDRYGSVTRADMKALQISPTRWTDHWNGFLSAGSGGWVRNGRTPDLKAQHPTNWAQIEANFEKWSREHQIAARLELSRTA